MAVTGNTACGYAIRIVSPGTARDNNGNWHTAARWAAFLAPHDVTIAAGWTAGEPAPDLLIALHARRSAAALAAFRERHPGRPALLVLTGTDLYRDIHDDATAAASLRSADALVLLQPAGLAELPDDVRGKAHVIYQSAPALPASNCAPDSGTVSMAGHLRDEKDPATFIRAAGLVTSPRARLLHIGGALDPALGTLARETAARLPRYRWLGALPQADVREHLRHSHAMAICSKMEGGANVIIEAVTAGVPVLASDISGNRGMLGSDYAGYFPVGDAVALARLIDRSVDDAGFAALLRAQCAARAPLFAPEAEQAALLRLVDNLLSSSPAHLPAHLPATTTS
jgi:putative glycosyltransferase (TIGR04348 family)